MGGNYYDHEEFERNQALIKEIFSPTLQNSRKLYERQLLEEREARQQAFLGQIAALREEPAQTLSQQLKRPLQRACELPERSEHQRPGRIVNDQDTNTLAPESP